MVYSFIIIGSLFVVLLWIAVRVLIKNNKESDEGCRSCPYRNNCKNKRNL